MTKKQRAEIIITELENCFPEVPIPLEHSDAFTLLVAVALSAQTTDKNVNKVTPALFAKANTPEKMASLKVDEIKELIKGLGLANNKAKNLQAMSMKIVSDFNGTVPQNYEDLESLPGVGHKTAAVVMSQAFGKPAFPVDTHIHRLLTKWRITRGKNVVETEKDAKKIFPKHLWNKLHLQIIYYGREFSPARGNLEKDYISKLVLAEPVKKQKNS